MALASLHVVFGKWLLSCSSPSAVFRRKYFVTESFITKPGLFVLLCHFFLHNAVNGFFPLYQPSGESIFLYPFQLTLNVLKVLSFISPCINRCKPPKCDESYVGLWSNKCTMLNAGLSPLISGLFEVLPAHMGKPVCIWSPWLREMILCNLSSSFCFLLQGFVCVVWNSVCYTMLKFFFSERQIVFLKKHSYEIWRGRKMK